MNRIIASLGALALSLGAALAQTPPVGEQGPLSIKGSLFDPANPIGLIEKRTAYKKGDVLTVIVSESAIGSNSAQTTSSKADSSQYSTSLPAVSAVSGQFLTGLLKNVANGALVGGNTAATSATAGAGATSVNTAFTTQIAVIVTDVSPNGVLTLEGKRTFKMNKQTQTILLQGVCRIDDISINNTVLSQNVAELRLIAEGKGLIANRQREGALTKLLSWLF